MFLLLIYQICDHIKDSTNKNYRDKQVTIESAPKQKQLSLKCDANLKN